MYYTFYMLAEINRIVCINHRLGFTVIWIVLVKEKKSLAIISLHELIILPSMCPFSAEVICMAAGSAERYIGPIIIHRVSCFKSMFIIVIQFVTFTNTDGRADLL